MKNVFLCFTLDKQSIIVNVSSSYLRPGRVNGATFLPELPSWWTKHSYSSLYWEVWTRITSEESLGKIHVWFDGNINVRRYLAFLELHDLGAGRGSGRRREGYGCDKAVSYNFGQNEWKTYTPPLPPQSKMGKWRVFALRAASSLIWGRSGWGLLFNFILSKIVSNLNVFEPLLTPKICYPKTDS